MSGESSVRLNMKEARELAELHGIRADIHGALQHAEFARQNSRTVSGLWAMLNEPIVIAIVVKYSRAFVHGVRRKLKDFDIANLPAELLETHEYLKSFRDKHVSHSVNGFEGNTARGVFDAARPEDGITSISCVHSKLTGLTDDQLDSVIKLCNFWIGYIDQIVVAEEEALLQMVRGMRVQDLLAVAPTPAMPIQFVDPVKPRSQKA